MVKVKICGLKDEANVRVAVENGADFLGFVFFDKSPRNISINDAKALAQFARSINHGVKICAVTVSPDDALLDNLKSSFAPDYIQLHGGENLARVRELQNRGSKIIKAFGVESADDIAKSNEFIGIAEYILFDAKPPNGSQNVGGFGVSFDWDLLGNLPQGLDWFLSGGLNPDNIADAIAATNARNVDVSSGIESSLGIKNPELIKSFIENSKRG